MIEISLYAVDNRGIDGMEHCFGAPFCAKNFAHACDLVKKALEKDKDKVNLDNFYLVRLCPYNLIADQPIPRLYDEIESICCSELFKEVNDEQE